MCNRTRNIRQLKQMISEHNYICFVDLLFDVSVIFGTQWDELHYSNINHD